MDKKTKKIPKLLLSVSSERTMTKSAGPLNCIIKYIRNLPQTLRDVMYIVHFFGCIRELDILEPSYHSLRNFTNQLNIAGFNTDF